MQIDERRFKEIYGEDAVEVEIGPGPTPAEARDAVDAPAYDPDIPADR